MVNKFKIVLGDYSCDGHCMTETIYVKSNYNQNEIVEAYNNSKKLTGLSFDNSTEPNIGVEWENNTIDYNDLEVLKKHGYDLLKERNIDREEDYDIDGGEDFIDIFFNFVKISLSNLEYEIIQDDTPTLSLDMGYGLFYTY